MVGIRSREAARVLSQWLRDCFAVRPQRAGKMITQLVSLDGVIAAVQDVDRGLIWIVEGGQPRLATYDLASGTLDRHMTLGSPPSSIALSGNRAEILIAMRDGRVLSVDADNPVTTTPVAT